MCDWIHNCVRQVFCVVFDEVREFWKYRYISYEDHFYDFFGCGLTTDWDQCNVCWKLFGYIKKSTMSNQIRRGSSVPIFTNNKIQIQSPIKNWINSSIRRYSEAIRCYSKTRRFSKAIRCYNRTRRYSEAIQCYCKIRRSVTILYNQKFQNRSKKRLFQMQINWINWKMANFPNFNPLLPLKVY